MNCAIARVRRSSGTWKEDIDDPWPGAREQRERERQEEQQRKEATTKRSRPPLRLRQEEPAARSASSTSPSSERVEVRTRPTSRFSRQRLMPSCAARCVH